MKFEEALPYFRNGKTIYRKAWSNNKKIDLCIMNGTIRYMEETTNTRSCTRSLNIRVFTVEDLCAADWDVINDL